MVERSGGRGVTVVEERCGGGGVIVGMERPKTEVAGLPPQAWHEAAFTRIARIRGEVIFPEKWMQNWKLLKLFEQIHALEEKLQNANNKKAKLKVKHKEDKKLLT
ncbi:hypothetical protein Tco_1034009 [Tanacetum coccineum]